jgi:equilibrative nucleoside transporter 1/2/3
VLPTPPQLRSTPEKTFTATQHTMERIRKIFERQNSAASYERLEGGSERPDGEHINADEQAFSWTDYAVFTLLGVAMLWAW